MDSSAINEIAEKPIFYCVGLSCTGAIYQETIVSQGSWSQPAMATGLRDSVEL